MRIIIFSFLGLLCCSVYSCTTNTSSSTTTDTATEQKYVSADSTNTPTDTIEDPDPADTIPASMYGINTYGKETENLVRAKLQALYKKDIDKDIIDSFSRRFIFFKYDLNDDNMKEIFVGLTGPYFCGSGGCTILLMDNNGGVITSFSVTGYPVIVAGSITNGWKDLILYSGRKNHLVKFDGKKYPSNPSVQPAFNETPGDDLPRLLNFISEPYAWFKF